jgi:hypothetical protein
LPNDPRRGAFRAIGQDPFRFRAAALDAENAFGVTAERRWLGISLHGFIHRSFWAYLVRRWRGAAALGLYSWRNPPSEKIIALNERAK